MQDLRPIPTGIGNAGRFFGGDRRLRPYPNQALKCPRCDSLNTKFCYYNNYNLSQPRHFCKSCRRYWTKGGVLRNVPEGGGCRKNKRSKPKSSSSDHHKEKKPKSSSSSDSSSLTGTNNNTSTTANEGATAASSSSVPPATPPGLLNFTDSRLFMNQETPNPSFESSSVLENLDQSTDAGGMFSDNGGFTNLMNVGNTYNFSDISPFRLNHQQQHHEEIDLQQEKMVNIVDEMKMQELTAGCIDQTVEIDMSGLHSRTHNGELTALDWQSSQGLFDLPNTVDQGYWSHNQWTETDQHLYLP
ncbi:hypothetical protein ACHQM5_006736 [Ranunculus cassubicifolius]